MSRRRLPTLRDRQAGPAQAPRGPACVRVRDAYCLCRECGDYVSVAHIVRGYRKAFCGRCCPVCRPKPSLHEDDHAA
jgi:hypothetical protein